MERKITFKNRAGKRIVGIWNLPHSIKPPFPAVVVCHGFKGYKEQTHLRTLAQTLAARGIAAFRFDFTNEIGESDGSIENISFGQKLRDLGDVVNYICHQSFVDIHRIGLAGHSQGAQAILMYTPTDRRIKVLADLAGPTYRAWGNLSLKKQLAQAKKSGFFVVESRSKRKKFLVKLKFYYEIQSYDTLKSIKKIRVPTLIVHGSLDRSVSVLHSHKAYALLPEPKKLVIVDGAPHTWKQSQYYRPINSLVASWFEIYI